MIGFRMHVVLVLSLLMVVPVAGTARDVDEPLYRGPHVDDMYYLIIKDIEAQRIAMSTLDVEMLPDLIRPDDLEHFYMHPDIDVDIPEAGFHMFYMAFNMRRDPLSDRTLRVAISHVVNRDEIIRDLFEGYVLPLETYVPPAAGDFYNPDVAIYEYDPELAMQILDEAGFTVDPDTGIRIDPQTGEPLPTMELLTPTYEVAPTSAELGAIIADAAQAIGIPIEAAPTDFPVILGWLDEQEFDMYVLAWQLGRNPTYLEAFFHSRHDVVGGYNNPGIRVPELDQALDRVRWPADRDEAVEASLRAQELLSYYQPYVTLYSRPPMTAFSLEWDGWVSQPGFGADNMWTWLNLHRRDAPFGGTFTYALGEEPSNLNPLVASSAYEWQVLNRIFDPLFAFEPTENLDQPWLGRWEVETWTYGGEDATKVTWYLREGVTWHDGEPFTADDVKFSLDYIKEAEVPRGLETWDEIVEVEVVDEHEVIIYYGSLSHWNLYRTFGATWLPKHIWQDVPVEEWEEFEPWREPHPEVEGLTKLIGTGPYIFREYVPGEYVYFEYNPNYWARHPDDPR